MLKKLPESPPLVNTGSLKNPVNIREAMLRGYATGNELFTYAQWPSISSAELSALQGKSFPTIFHLVTRKFLGDSIPDADQIAIAEAAYSPENFNFDVADRNLRVTRLPSGEYIVGLSDGPTGSFKDQAIQAIVRWMGRYLDGDLMTTLVTSTGDTLPATQRAAAEVPNIEVVGMIPDKGVSEFQGAQMKYYLQKYGGHLLKVMNDFTFANNLHMQADRDFDLGTFNSVNIGRIIAQIPYHVAARLKVAELTGRDVRDPIITPIQSGNAGNVLSKIYEDRKMGLSPGLIVPVSNENNTLDIFFRHGVLVRQYDAAQRTDSSAQDITMPSNIWRYIFTLFGNNPEKQAAFWKEFNKFGTASVNKYGVDDESIRENVRSVTITAQERKAITRDVYRQSDRQIILDPHTANSVAAVRKLKLKRGKTPIVVYETAKPFKFDDTTVKRLGRVAARPIEYIGLEERYGGMELPQISDFKDLAAYLDEHTHARRKQAA